MNTARATGGSPFIGGHALAAAAGSRRGPPCCEPALQRPELAWTRLRVVMSPDRDLAYVANVSPKGETITVVHRHSLDTEDIQGMRDANGLSFSRVLPLTLRTQAH
jgi:hypothetical protein